MVLLMIGFYGISRIEASSGVPTKILLERPGREPENLWNNSWFARLNTSSVWVYEAPVVFKTQETQLPHEPRAYRYNFMSKNSNREVRVNLVVWHFVCLHQIS